MFSINSLYIQYFYVTSTVECTYISKTLNTIIHISLLTTFQLLFFRAYVIHFVLTWMICLCLKSKLWLHWNLIFICLACNSSAHEETRIWCYFFHLTDRTLFINILTTYYYLQREMICIRQSVICKRFN